MLSTGNKVHNLDPLEPQKLLRNLLRQKTEGSFCDVKLCLQGSEMWGHACVLAPLSSYIMDHFCPNSDVNHWCPQKPLVIDLDIVLTVSQDKCVPCLSTLLDFMYSQDLVILDGHLQHFSKMIYYLKVVDLFPLLNTNVYHGNLSSLSKEPNVQDFSLKSDNSLLKTVQNDKPRKVLALMPKETDPKNSSEITNPYKEQPDKENQLNTSQEVNQSCDNSESVLSCSERVDTINEEHNYGLNLKPKCEFLCCTGEAISSKPSTNHRRKIGCEMCSFSAVSVKKVLKHIESTGHLTTVCPICTQKFPSTDSLQQHLKDHDNLKPYLCQFCSKRTRFWEFYKGHLKVHCRNKKLFCEICQRKFESQQNLKVHLKKNHKTNYLCSSCSYLTSDAEAFKAHLLIHKEKAPSTLDVENSSFSSSNYTCDNDLLNHKTTTQFLCSLCGKGFTQKNNLKRHTELQHSNVPNFHCFKCTYVTKRTDVLKSHMKRRHNCLPEEVESLLQKATKRPSKKQKLDKDQSEGVIGVLIPVQLVSTNDSTTLSAFAVKTAVKGEPKSGEENSCRKNLKLDVNNENYSSSSRSLKSEISVLKTLSLSENVIENKFSFAENFHMNINGSLETSHRMPCLINSGSMNNNSELLQRNNEKSIENDFTEKVHSIDNNLMNLQLSLNAGNPPCNKNIDLTQPVSNIAEEFSDLQITLEERHTNLNSFEVEPDLLTRRGEFWLNEATGEFLNENSLVNVQVIDTSCRFKTVVSSSENPCEDKIDSLHTLVLSDTSKNVSILDLRDDVEDFTSNPQTPQTNLVEVDDPDNLFPWRCIDSSFCSTWVLNETTGELNMVSFNVQPIKHSDESKLDENTGMFSCTDDDETALFLNEGTGDLSVIYFNPSNQECVSSKQLCNEQGIQDVPDNVSEHSNDEEDFLNAEFFEATASFMAHKENETFLNELTGEFDTNIADFTDYCPDLLENQISASESYLNEETGEILWNVLNKNVSSDFFTNTESFKYDLDDSLNCDDFEPFVDGMNDFSSQFHLQDTQDWQPVDETCDTLLNECTGELVKKS